MAVVIKNVEDFENLNESELEELYSWVDGIPLSRPKKNINRDFSDGVLAAEVIKHFLPKAVDTHNYTAASSTVQKMENWDLLNRKVFKKLNFQLSQDSIRAISTGKQFSIECFLMYLRSKIERAMWDMDKDVLERNEKAHAQQKSTARLQHKGMKFSNDQPEADQNITSNKKIPPASLPIHHSLPIHQSHSTGKIPKMKPQVSPGRQKQAPTGPYRGAKAKQIDDVVPRPIYEEKEQECLAKEETIQILHAKVRRLEHLLHLKDIRIEDLQSRLESNRPTGNNIRR